MAKIRIMLADDHTLFRQGIRTLISAESDMEVVGEASNGHEALTLARKLTPDVIVMDVTMPVLDGIEATRLIKASEVTRHARVIAYTGNPAFEANPDRTLFAAVLPKPATPEAVLQAVQRVATFSPDGGRVQSEPA